ncbi:MAG: N-acetylglucosamine-6-phosphate deacetylase [Oscillospiraceae bacterium]|nr:N-acetylglucosamine-6-phosphate deacetylase [Oscillospiraceae bacterium]
MLIKHAKVFQENGGFASGDIAISGQYFADTAPGGEIIDATGCYAIPGLIDLHIHGCVDHDFSDTDAQGLSDMAHYLAENGITAICPTLLTLPENQLAAACRQIATHADLKGAAFAGLYLEGPFLSPKKCGAQNPAYIQPPDVELVRRLQAQAGGMVKLLAVAPEMDGAICLIDALGDEIVCSVAHTEANYTLAQAAFAHGARQVTHLFNATPPLHHRDPGVIGAAMDALDCRAELICDGVHVHPSAVRAALRMFGDDRIIFISDNMSATGMADGVYDLGGLAVEVRGRCARLVEGDSIAGSVVNLMDCLRTAVTEMGIPLATAVKCASVNPAKALGIFHQRGSIAPGKYADLVLLNEDLSIRAVFLRGEILS